MEDFKIYGLIFILIGLFQFILGIILVKRMTPEKISKSLEIRNNVLDKFGLSFFKINSNNTKSVSKGNLFLGIFFILIGLFIFFFGK